MCDCPTAKIESKIAVLSSRIHVRQVGERFISKQMPGKVASRNLGSTRIISEP